MGTQTRGSPVLRWPGLTTIALSLILPLAGCGSGGGGSGGSDDSSGGDTTVPDNPLDGGGDSSDGGDSGDGGSNGDSPDDGFSSWNWSDPTTLSREGYDTADPNVAIGPNGAMAAIWVVDSSDGPQIRTAYRGKNANSWNDPVQIDAGTDNIPIYSFNYLYYSRSNPQIAFGGDKIFAVWEEKQKNPGTRNTIYAAIRTGGNWLDPKPLMETDANSASYPRLVVDSNGNATVGWLQSTPANDNKPPQVMVADYDADNASWSDPQKASGSVPPTLSEGGINSTEDNLTMAINENGQPAIVYPTQKDGEPTHKLWYGERDSAVGDASGQFSNSVVDSIDSEAKEPIKTPDLMFDTRGQAVLAYDYGDEIRVRWNGGDGWSEPTDAAALSVGSRAPNLAKLAKGRFILIYTQDEEEGVNDSWYLDAYARRYKPSEGFQPATKLDTLGGLLPKVASNGTDKAAAAWYDAHTWASTYQDGSWANKGKVLGYNSGRAHRVAMNGSGETVIIAVDGNSPNKVEATTYD